MNGPVVLASLIAVGLLPGCAAPPQVNPRQQFSAAMAECSAQHPLEAPGTSVARNQCIIDAEDKYVRPTTTFPDLLDVSHAYRMAYAEKVDANQMTTGDARLAMAKLQVQLTSIGEQRRIARMNANAGMLAAQAASMQTLVTQLGALQGRQPSTVNTSCNRVGNAIDCQTSSM